MNIDRSLFLAFAASLSAAAVVGCSSGDDSTSGDSQEVNASQGLCYSAAESTSGSARAYWTNQIGFDPVANYPAAESFCFKLAAGPTGQFDWDGPQLASQQGIYEKCQTYARNYVALTTFEAFRTMKSIPVGLGTSEKFSKLYEIDRAIAAEGFFCEADAAAYICEGEENMDCSHIVSQIRQDKLRHLVACTDAGFDAYSCIEGAGGAFRGR